MRRKELSALTTPWCTYNDPEIAHVGLYVKECCEQGFSLKAFTVPMSDVDRAVLDGEPEGVRCVFICPATFKERSDA